MEVCDAVGCARDGRRAKTKKKEKKIERPLSSVGVVAGRSSAIFFEFTPRCAKQSKTDERKVCGDSLLHLPDVVTTKRLLYRI